jgi:ABC-2 type transport system ATP-binding protein
MDHAMRVEDVSKRFRIYHERNQSMKSAIMRRGRAKYEEFWALRDVDLEIPQGKTFGLVGHNGSGKSTLLKCLARILVPDSGSVTTNGRVSALLELGAGFHGELSGRDNVYLNGSILGLSKRDIDARFDDIVGFAGLEQFIDTPVKNYSSGMYVRLGFSVAINVEPDILLVDEVLAVGDESFQRRSAEKFQEFRDAGRTIVVVSHAMGSLRSMCDEVAWLDHGRVLGVGEADEIIGRYSDSTGTPAPAPEEPSHEARVTDVAVLVDGRPTSELRSGGPARVRVAWTTSRPLGPAELVLTVRTPDGITVAVSRSSVDRAPLPTGTGSAAMELAVPQWPTAAGNFVLDVALERPGGGRPVDRLADAASVVVHPADGDTGGGLVRLAGSWA